MQLTTNTNHLLRCASVFQDFQHLQPADPLTYITISAVIRAPAAHFNPNKSQQQPAFHHGIAINKNAAQQNGCMAASAAHNWLEFWTGKRFKHLSQCVAKTDLFVVFSSYGMPNLPQRTTPRPFYPLFDELPHVLPVARYKKQTPNTRVYKQEGCTSRQHHTHPSHDSQHTAHRLQLAP